MAQALHRFFGVFFAKGIAHSAAAVVEAEASSPSLAALTLAAMADEARAAHPLHLCQAHAVRPTAPVLQRTAVPIRLTAAVALAHRK